MVAADGLVDVAGRELVQLLVVAEDDDCDVDGAEDGKLMSLLEEAAFALQKGAAEESVSGLGGKSQSWSQSRARSQAQRKEQTLEARHTLSGCGRP